MQREKFNNYRIKELESQLFLIEEKYRKEKEKMENKILELEKLLKQSQELLTEKDQKYEKTISMYDGDIVNLITQGLLYKIEYNEMKNIVTESMENRKITTNSNCLMNNRCEPENVSQDIHGSETNFFIDRESIIKMDIKNNLKTIPSNKYGRGCYENESQSCLYSEISKKNLLESKKSLDDIPKNIFSNIKSRNKLPNKNCEIKSLNDLEVTPPIYETYQEPLGELSIFKTSDELSSLKNINICKTPNLDINSNKIMSSQTVHIDSVHKNIDKNSRNLNIKINSTANLIKNSGLISKIDKLNFNYHNSQLGSNVFKSYKNFNEINGNLKEKFDRIKPKGDKNLHINQVHNKANLANKFTTNYNNYKMIKPEKKNLIFCNKSSKNLKPELNKYNQSYKKSFDLDKHLNNVNVSQYQLMGNNSDHKILDQREGNVKDQWIQNGKIINNRPNILDKNKSSNQGYKYPSELDINNNSSISKSPLLRIQDISDLQNNENESYNINLTELKNKSSKFSRNEKKNELSNLYLNTCNNSNNLAKINLTTQYHTYKHDLTCYDSYNVKENDVVFMDINNKIKNKNNKSIDLIRNVHIGFDQQNLTCMNKGQKIINFTPKNQAAEQNEKFPNNMPKNDLKRLINSSNVFKNNKSTSDIYNELKVYSDSNKNNISKAIVNEYTKPQNPNKTSTLNLILNDNCKSKKTLIKMDKRNDNNMFNLNMNNLVSQIKKPLFNMSETSSKKKLSKDSKFKN